MPSMLRASFLKSILPLTGEEAEARPKVGTAPQAELLGAFLSRGRGTTPPFPRNAVGYQHVGNPSFSLLPAQAAWLARLPAAPG